MAKHACPDCGASHDMDTAGRIARLEERVKELEAHQPCTLPHYYYPIYYPNVPQWTWTNTTTPPDLGPVTVYSSSNLIVE